MDALWEQRSRGRGCCSIPGRWPRSHVLRARGGGGLRQVPRWSRCSTPAEGREPRRSAGSRSPLLRDVCAGPRLGRRRRGLPRRRSSGAVSCAESRAASPRGPRRPLRPCPPAATRARRSPRPGQPPASVRRANPRADARAGLQDAWRAAAVAAPTSGPAPEAPAAAEPRHDAGDHRCRSRNGPPPRVRRHPPTRDGRAHPGPAVRARIADRLAGRSQAWVMARHPGPAASGWRCSSGAAGRGRASASSSTRVPQALFLAVQPLGGAEFRRARSRWSGWRRWNRTPGRRRIDRSSPASRPPDAYLNVVLTQRLAAAPRGAIVRATPALVTELCLRGDAAGGWRSTVPSRPVLGPEARPRWSDRVLGRAARRAYQIFHSRVPRRAAVLRDGRGA